MSRNGKTPANTTMLDMWRPPHGAGDALGCLATTYTFEPGLFDEQCLARLLEIESEPNREDLAFLLERESRLGGIYAGVLVDHTQAGVAHSLRWDVLPVCIQGSRQHAKLSVLAWDHLVRIIVASANLTEPGYRFNREVAGTLDLTPEQADTDALSEAVLFLRSLLRRVPGASERPREIERAEGFLAQVERQVRRWKPPGRASALRRRLVFTQPAAGPGTQGRSSLEEAVEACRARGGSPREAWVASPFFDEDEAASRVTASLCKSMARGGSRRLTFCVPAAVDQAGATAVRLAAPRALLQTPAAYQGDVRIDVLPERDEQKNARPWHAKLLMLRADEYVALLVGSSNFTCAGMGVTARRNTEANLLTIADRVSFGRDAGQLESLWPQMVAVEDPESAEWLGARPDDEDEQQGMSVLPAGFLAASYRAGDHRQVILRFDPPHLPEEWSMHGFGHETTELVSASSWREGGSPTRLELPWQPVLPPEKLLVRWAEGEAFLPLNVEEGRDLPAPAELNEMSADDMLRVLAASDPSAAFRAWAKQRQPVDPFDADLDSATPVDLDPLRRYDLEATFLHRVRRRARVLAQLRSNLERPVWSRQALEWRLRGLVGVEALADRLVREVESADGRADEALLTLADFLILLQEVDYRPGDGALARADFEGLFRPFLLELAGKLRGRMATHRDRLSGQVMEFWERVVDRCEND